MKNTTQIFEYIEYIYRENLRNAKKSKSEWKISYEVINLSKIRFKNGNEHI